MSGCDWCGKSLGAPVPSEGCVNPEHNAAVAGPPWYGSSEGKAMFDALVDAQTCYICDPDNPAASPEGCAGCDREWQEAIIAANRARHSKDLPSSGLRVGRCYFCGARRHLFFGICLGEKR